MMAPSCKGRVKKKLDAMAESESQKTPRPCTAEEMAVKISDAGEPPSAPEKPEPVESPCSKPEGASDGEPKALADESGDEQMLSGEKEEEQAFLVNLYKFMKERHTPIERVPHLGFKQINLFKIYKVVEKLGAYELVTGRRLWKNVYDLLGGSPGSTSAATCTRRHYERLVLPYVRHLKGEDDKPLPPVQPRKQYKVSKEPKGDKGSSLAEKKRPRKEKAKEQVLPEKRAPEGLLSDPKPSPGLEPNQTQGRPGGCLSVPNGQEIPEPQAANSCHGNCRAHSCSETYKRLFSSFYVNGTHGIMSPLAKKKLLAQVSKEEALSCHGKHLSHCPADKKTSKHDISGPDPEAGTWLSSHCQKQAPKKVEAVEDSPAGSSQAPKGKEGPLKVPLKDNHHPPQKAEDGSSGGCTSVVPPVFGGSSYTSRSDVPKPGSCHHPRGPVESSPALRDAPALSLPSYQQLGKKMAPGGLLPTREEGPEDQPEDLSRKPLLPPAASSSSSSSSSSSWRGESRPSSAFRRRSPSGTRGPSPFPHARPPWAPPVTNLAKVSPQVVKSSSGQTLPASEAGGTGLKRRAADEDLYMPGKKLKAVSPFFKDLDPTGGVERSPSPSGARQVAKPKATVASPAFPVAPVPQVQDMYKGMMVRLPLNIRSPEEHFKGQLPSLIPSLSVSPFLIPAFPTPLLTASVQPSDLCPPLGTGFVHCPSSYDGTLRQRLCPLPPWHSPPAYATPHVPAFHRNTKL